MRKHVVVSKKIAKRAKKKEVVPGFEPGLPETLIGIKIWSDNCNLLDEEA
jgi:hypothetical protein